LIESARMFFLATADALGKPDCSYKGGLPGFVRIVDERTLAFPDYNGQWNVPESRQCSFEPERRTTLYRLRPPATASYPWRSNLTRYYLLLAEFAGAQLIVRVRATRIFPNCPRYIHEMRLVKHSVYVPTQHHTPPVPVWKQWEEFRRVLPQSEPIPPRSLSTCGSWNSEAVCSAFSSVLCDEQGSRRIESCVPDYNGNGIYRSLGNVLVNQSVALLFIDFERPQPCDARSDYGRRQCV